MSALRDVEKRLEQGSAERRPIRTFMPDVLGKGEESVDAAEEAYHTKNGVSDRAVDREKEVDETGKEEEEGHMEQGKYGLDNLRETKCLHALEEMLLPRTSRACTSVVYSRAFCR